MDYAERTPDKASQTLTMGETESKESMEGTSVPPPAFMLAASSAGEAHEKATGGQAKGNKSAAAQTPVVPRGMRWSEGYPHLVKITAHNGWTLQDVAQAFYGNRSLAQYLEVTNNRTMRLGATQTPLPRNTEVRLQFEHLSQAWKRRVYTLLYIAPRESWDARTNRPHGDGYDYFEYADPEHALHSIAVHHTGNRSKLQDMNALQDYHMDKEDKADVAYHYAINQRGQIIEGRPVEVRGSHVDGRNTGVIGIVFLADLQTGPFLDFDGDNEVNDKMLAAANTLVAHLLGRFPNVTTLGGHQEYVNTECPGDMGQPYAEAIRSRFGLGIPAHSDSQASDGTGGHGTGHDHDHG